MKLFRRLLAGARAILTWLAGPAARPPAAGQTGDEVADIDDPFAW